MDVNGYRFSTFFKTCCFVSNRRKKLLKAYNPWQVSKFSHLGVLWKQFLSLDYIFCSDCSSSIRAQCHTHYKKRVVRYSINFKLQEKVVIEYASHKFCLSRLFGIATFENFWLYFLCSYCNLQDITQTWWFITKTTKITTCCCI